MDALTLIAVIFGTAFGVVWLMIMYWVFTDTETLREVMEDKEE